MEQERREEADEEGRGERGESRVVAHPVFSGDLRGGSPGRERGCPVVRTILPVETLALAGKQGGLRRFLMPVDAGSTIRRRFRAELAR
jgi:hypothetical protein